MRLPINKLSVWQQITFSAALLERMLPNYKMFSEATDVGDYRILRNQLNLVWQRLDKKQKVNINCEVQLEKLEAEIPDPEQFSFFGVFPALDACMALNALLQYIQDNDIELINQISRLSHNSVSAYVELLILEENSEIEDVDPLLINQDPLMKWEQEMQNAMFDLLQQSPENIQTIKAIKDMALGQGLSNLGMEIA
ncbi:YjaG family protein [Thalassotalea hakodatensis]|uniref:YjaG family protein n=1 Tax=Thalassotalea hakodatensis TaxID=3030492 RepID=UPI0025736D33|nr:YjaG family protein [Thalassotalea hakodatensis]